MQISYPVFKAIADPTRRRIIDLLAKSNCSVTQLTASFQISQPAISQHLRELKASNLVASERVGLEQRYRLTPGPLREVYGWVSQYKDFFDPAGHAWRFSPVAEESVQRERKKGQKNDGD